MYTNQPDAIQKAKLDPKYNKTKEKRTPQHHLLEPASKNISTTHTGMPRRKILPRAVLTMVPSSRPRGVDASSPAITGRHGRRGVAVPAAGAKHALVGGGGVVGAALVAAVHEHADGDEAADQDQGADYDADDGADADDPGAGLHGAARLVVVVSKAGVAWHGAAVAGGEVGEGVDGGVHFVDFCLVVLLLCCSVNMD
ncbi:hypothetical protein MCOR03_009195 [Pyricularia oryzae]|nr:hypothetical protein MCOR19_003404 [Pyricularia oryzae]KAI6343728.1 hypothetical protein MCOR30_001400 [Pyricularia oryzae]KAI6484195.1 hypothetical protein MCOR18_004071 [Pyricularia oryzae]KAI6524082.1 hypothetical protein MCOR10_005017 [Pyricularia oryzae]KAI6550909.1 hypothetical protein MCOR03_009195 [Pyricularia oryzae]